MKEYFEKNIQPELDNLNNLLDGEAGIKGDTWFDDNEVEDSEYDTLGGLLDPHYVNYEQE